MDTAQRTKEFFTGLQERIVERLEQVDGICVRRTLRAGVVGAQAGWIEASFMPASTRLSSLTPQAGRP